MCKKRQIKKNTRMSIRLAEMSISAKKMSEDFKEMMNSLEIANKRSYLINTFSINTGKMSDQEIEQTITKISDAARLAGRTL